MALSKKHRLNGKDFERVLKRGKTVKNGFFFIRFLKNEVGHGRVAVLVTVKVSKKSTVRNYLRRIMIGTVGTSGFLEKPLDAVFIAAPRIVGKSFGEIKSGLTRAIKVLFVK
jgi:ribonuclease P protein component